MTVRPSTVPKLNTDSLSCVKRRTIDFPAPESQGETFADSSRYKKFQRKFKPLQGPDRDYGNLRRPSTAQSASHTYHTEKRQVPWKSNSRHIPGYTGHIHGAQHIEGMSITRTSEHALRRNFSAGDTVKINPRVYMGKRTRESDLNHRFHIKNYSGFIRGSQHIHGRTFQKTSEMALNRGIKELCCTSPIPCDPHAKYLNTTTAAPIKNYTGFIPRKRYTHGKTFGKTFTLVRSQTPDLARRRQPTYPKNARFWDRNYAIVNPREL